MRSAYLLIWDLTGDDLWPEFFPRLMEWKNNVESLGFEDSSENNVDIRDLARAYVSLYADIVKSGLPKH